MNVLIGRCPALLLVWSHGGDPPFCIGMGSNRLTRQLPFGLIVPIGLFPVPGEAHLSTAEGMAERLWKELDRRARNRNVVGIGRDLHRAAEWVTERIEAGTPTPAIPPTHDRALRFVAELMEAAGLPALARAGHQSMRASN